MTETLPATRPSPVRQLLRLSVPALVVGVAASVILLVVTDVANQLEHVLWSVIPQAFGVSGNAPAWIVLILTLTGVAVGLIVWKMPGHAGPDPATLGLVEPPLALSILPSLLLALILMLAGGVSLGPENPIMGITIAVVYALGSRLIPVVGAQIWVGLATAGMLGAMFGTPVAAALVLTESMAAGDSQVPLWDRLFGPMVAAGAGSLTTDALSGGQLSMSVSLPPYPGANLPDLLIGAVLASVAALLGLVTVYAFRGVYPLFKRVTNTLLALTLGGVLLGILGAVGGPITLFKGLDQMKELAQDASQYSAAGLVLVTLVKMAALVIAGTCAFRGGRIFPSVFIGVAAGLAFNAFLPFVPPALTVACAVLGFLLAITRQGWLSLFMAAVMVPDINLIPILTLVMLPAWLLVTGRPQMQIQAENK
ncbi:MAG: ion channel protein [Chloroflexi bacterium]|nr:ion channel protein [Chloroflexota bacterium]